MLLLDSFIFLYIDVLDYIAMPPKREPGIQGGNRFKAETNRKRWERANETTEQTRLRLETQRELQSARRDGESESETAVKLLTQKADPVHSQRVSE